MKLVKKINRIISALMILGLMMTYTKRVVKKIKWRSYTIQSLTRLEHPIPKKMVYLMMINLVLMLQK